VCNIYAYVKRNMLVLKVMCTLNMFMNLNFLNSVGYFHNKYCEFH
jgi:hypothetical protein